jgi:hypothetical protein
MDELKLNKTILNEDCCLLGCDVVWLLQEPIYRRNVEHGLTSQKTTFFMVTSVKTSNLT